MLSASLFNVSNETHLFCKSQVFLFHACLTKEEECVPKKRSESLQLFLFGNIQKGITLAAVAVLSLLLFDILCS